MIETHKGIPVTTPARTIADIEATRPVWEARRALRQAEYLGLDLGPEIESDRTRSDLERDFLTFCRRHRLPPPEVNVRIGVWTVDSSGAPNAWPSRPTSMEPTAAPSPSRTITGATSTFGASATASAATPAPSSATTRPRWLRIWARSWAALGSPAS